MNKPKNMLGLNTIPHRVTKKASQCVLLAVGGVCCIPPTRARESLGLPSPRDCPKGRLEVYHSLLFNLNDTLRESMNIVTLILGEGMKILSLKVGEGMNIPSRLMKYL